MNSKHPHSLRKGLMSHLLIPLLLSLTATTNADALMDNVEYHVTASDLKTFSRAAINVVLCEGCLSRSFELENFTLLQEKQQTIDLQRATELYLRRTYREIFIGIERSSGSVNYINFGGYASDEY